MTEHNGAHGEAGATNASTDASLHNRIKTTKSPRGRLLWLLSAVVAVVLLAAALLAGRGGSARQGSTVTVGLKLAPTNLDIRNQSGTALDQALIGNVYEGLVARDSDNQVVPALAQSWQESADGLTYTFTLHNNMVFSNGDVLNADDVAWSLNELISKQYHDSDMLRNVTSVEAVDPRTVRISLSAPYSELLWSLSGRAGLVFDKDAQYDAKTQAVGSGPFLVDSFAPNDRLVLTKNPRYWGDHPAQVDTVVLRYFTDDTAALNALTSGDVQILAPINETLTAPLRAKPDQYTIKVGEGTDKYVLAFNNKGEHTADLRVRQAIRYGIDHDQIIASLGGLNKPLGGPIPSLDPGYQDLTDVYPHDVDKAKELMRQAGYTTEHPLALTLTYANTYGTEIGDLLRSQLHDIGIDLTLNVVEFSTWLQDVYTNKQYDLSLVDHNESHDFSQWANPKYYYNYDNQQVQQLYDQAMSAMSDAQRDDALAQAARIVSQDAPADWLFNYRVSTAWVHGVSGFPVNLNQSLMPLYNVRFDAA